MPPSGDPRPRLSATVSPLLQGRATASLRDSLAWLSETGFRAVQLSATDPALRPRELDLSARRDLAATLRRLELECSGLDLFLPQHHLVDQVHSTRAFDAVVAALELASLLGRVPVTVPLPPREECELRPAIAAAADKHGVSVLLPVVDLDDLPALVPPFAASVDCAAVLAQGGDPVRIATTARAALGGVRVVDLLRSGLRGPILEPRESRLDALGLRVALDAIGFTGYPVVDARQWPDAGQGLRAVLARWSTLLPG